MAVVSSRSVLPCAQFMQCRLQLQSLGNFPAGGLGGSFLGLARSGCKRGVVVVAKVSKGKTQKPSGSVTKFSAPVLTEIPVEEIETKLQSAQVKEVERVKRVEVDSDIIVQKLWRKVVRQLASLPLAIAELFAIAGLSAVGTVITQGERPAWYFQNFPDSNPVLGFLSWQWILGLGLDHVYTSPIYLGLLAMLAGSLMACTSTTQLPIVKVARRWSFLKSTKSFSKLDITDSLPKARLSDLGSVLLGHGYQVFARGGTVSAACSLRGTVMVPQGLDFRIGDALGSGFLGPDASVLDSRVHVNKFYIDYRENGQVGQFHSDLAIVDPQDQIVSSKTISVNDPMRIGGVTMYQTDWGISAVQLRVDGSQPYNLPMAGLQTGDNKLFGSFLPLGDQGAADGKGISILARDLQTVVFYDQEGNFVGVRRPGSKKAITVNNVNIVVDDLIGSTGLELKADPGVPVVYAGFGGLMLTTIISYLSHSQVWALQDGSWLVVGGKSNRAKLDFERELNDLLDLVPEVPTLEEPVESPQQ
uniref:ResB-like domain-containing protein n=1 Tax=Physcomitrium patens TaxID=3218 RepID=A0A7I4DV93_PHYPA